MAATTEFRLPDTPPQDHTFPSAEVNVIQSTGVNDESGPRRARKPSLTIKTQEVTPPAPQPRIPPPPPRALAPGSAGKTRSDSHPVRPVQVTAAHLPSPPPRNQQRKRNSTGTALSVTPTHRSMFPRYNPAAPAEPEAPVINVSGVCSPEPNQGDFQSTYTQSTYSAARSPPMHQGPSLSQAFAAPAEPVNCPLPSYRESMYGVPVVIQSNPTDVLDLWCLANGQDDQELALSYNLGLDSTDLTVDNELICLTSTAGAVYTLRATNNALNITRTHPLNGSNSMSIAAPTLYTPSETSQLITTTFPVLAKIRAIDQAASLAISHALGRSQGLALEREQITKAHAHTAAPLMWNKQTQSYYISLPQCSFNLEDTDEKPVHHILPIEITPNVSIRVLEPPSAHSAINPILTMSLHAKTLIVHSHALANLPTPYGADIVISSMMTLLLHLHRTTGLLSPDHVPSSSAADEPIPTFAPPPTSTRAGRSSSRTRNANRDRSSSRARAGSRLANFLHPTRSGLPSPTSAASQPRSRSALAVLPSSQLRTTSRLSTHSAAATTLHGSPPLHGPTTPGLEKGFEMGSMEVGLDQQLSERGTAPELSGAKTGVDLSRFQAYDLADPRLGGGTRALLRVLYWSFGVCVWVLGVIVGVIAEAIVVVGRCGGGRKK